jgi:signal transduction histidine kinase
VKALTRRSPVPVDLTVRVAGRLPDRVELGAYYIVSEALANVAKHSKASVARVEVEATSSVLRLDIRDDGVGGADSARGSGLIGLKDRVEAIGGTFRMKSRHGDGTQLLIELPIRPLQSASD